MKIIVFTSNFRGGISQFSFQIAYELSNLNNDVSLYIPNNSEYTEKNEYNFKIIKYSKNLKINTITNKLKSQIKKENIDLIIFSNKDVVDMNICNRIYKNVKSVLCIHDAKKHPSKFNLYNFCKEVYIKYLLQKTIKHKVDMIFMSNSTKNIFLNYHKEYKGNTYILPLSAHVEESYISDIINEKDYVLFFGRIEKYKGLNILLKAYTNYDNTKLPKLIIAGSGDFFYEEKILINKLEKQNKILVINKFIDDSLAIELFRKSKVLILPYIEASQSGIIPLAYKNNKPVIISNHNGLEEFVLNKKTGLIFKNKDSNDLYKKILELNDKKYYDYMKKNINKYYNEKLNWKINLENLIKNIGGVN